MGSVVSLNEEAIRALVAQSVTGGAIRNGRLYLQRQNGVEIDAGPVGTGSGGGNSIPIQVLGVNEWDAIKPGLTGTLYIVVPSTAPVSPWTFEANFNTPGTPTTFDTGQPFVVVGGTWTVADGALKATADGAIILGNLASKTQTLEVAVKGPIIASSFPTLVFRYDANNGYHYRLGKHNTSEMTFARRDPNQVEVFKTNTGVFPTSGPMVVRGEISGEAPNTAFRLWINDTEIKTSATGAAYVEGVGFIDTDTTPPLGEMAGVRYGASGSGGTYSYDHIKAAARKNVGA